MTTHPQIPERAARVILRLGVLLVCLAASAPAHAGGRVEMSDDAWVELGLMGQFQLLVSDWEGGAGEQRADARFLLRRARIMTSGQVMDGVGFALQSEVGSPEGGPVVDMRVLEAFIMIGGLDWLEVRLGLQLVPTSRQSITAAPRLLAFDRPNIHAKALSWGTRATTRLGTTTLARSDIGLGLVTASRDVGATAWGVTSFSDDVHLKYYLGVYEGSTFTDARYPHLAGRLQVSVLDPERGFMYGGSHLGELRTVGLGVSVEQQSSVGHDEAGSAFDYLQVSADAYAELPVGPGSVTAEAAFTRLDLGGAETFDSDNDPTTPGVAVDRATGLGGYAMAGYHVAGWQPWALYETWQADASAGSFHEARAGLTYYLKGHGAKITLAYEHMMLDEGDAIQTGALGLFIVY